LFRPMLTTLFATATLTLVGGSMVPGAMELGVLSCTVGAVVSRQAAGAAAEAIEAHEMVCTFRAHRSGAEESYAAIVKNATAMEQLPERLTLLFLVKGPFGTRAKPGFLQQAYALDPGAVRPATAPLAGERNPEISLQPMADAPPGSAASAQAPKPQYVITGVELVLRAAVG
jgi:hypothetical protein